MVLGSCAFAAIGASNFILSSNGDGSTNTLIKKPLADGVQLEAIVAVTQTLIEESDGERRAVRVVVFSVCLS